MTNQIITIRPDRTIMTKQNLPNYVGVSAETAGATALAMNIVIIPPGAAADPHYHDGFETAIYILEGSVRTLYGDGLRQETINHAGDFMFIPANVPHQPINMSATEPARALISRNDPKEQESVVPYVVAGGS
jgi:uncharacterized RmlC-like cupin family protein